MALPLALRTVNMGSTLAAIKAGQPVAVMLATGSVVKVVPTMVQDEDGNEMVQMDTRMDNAKGEHVLSARIIMPPHEFAKAVAKAEGHLPRIEALQRRALARTND